MRIEQITTSRLLADEGKVLVRKSDGYIVGPSIHLGYNYYDAGLPNAAPHATTPDDYDEIDMPENWQDRSVIRPVPMLKRATEICRQYTAEMNSLGLSAADALAVQNWFPQLYETEGFREGDAIVRGAKVQYDGKLWAAMQDHTITGVYAPSIDTASLWVEVTEDYVDGVEQGTKENPIEYDGNMILEQGKYYTQNGLIYLCVRDSINPVYHNLADLIDIYVDIIDE